MILLALSLGPPLEMIITFFIFILAICIFIVLTIFRLLKKKLPFKIIILISICSPVLLILAVLIAERIYDFFKSPMTVRKYNIEGDYVINRKMFPGKNCDWQFEHYTLHIDRDTLCLNILNNSKLIKTFKRPIFYIDRGKHTFFEFYNYQQIDSDAQKEIDNYDFDSIAEKYRDSMNPDQAYIMERIEIETDSIRAIMYDSIVTIKRDSAYCHINHHLLKQNPLLHADPFNFNIVLQSTKYGNMFFTKGNRNEKYK